MKKFALSFICFLIMITGCSNKQNINLEDYKRSYQFSLLDVGKRLFADQEGKKNVFGFSADDVVYSVKKVSTDEFIIRKTFPQLWGSIQYEFYQNKALPPVPSDDFVIKNAFLFYYGDTSSSSDREGHFTIYPKFQLSSDLVNTIKSDLAEAALSYETVTKDLDWNTSSVHNVIDIGMTFENYPSIFWKAQIILCNGNMYYVITDTENGEENSYYSVNESAAEFIKQNIDTGNYFS